MSNKITKRTVIGMMMNEQFVKDNATYMAYLENELAILDKKASSKKASKTQVENVGIKEIILATLEGNKPMTITEIQSANTELGALSNQKVSALVRQLVEGGQVVKTIDKKKSYFSLAD